MCQSRVLCTWHMSYEETILSLQLLSLKSLIACVAIERCRILPAVAYTDRRLDSAATIDHSHDFMDFGPRDFLPSSIMVDLHFVTGCKFNPG